MHNPLDFYVRFCNGRTQKNCFEHKLKQIRTTFVTATIEDRCGFSEKVSKGLLYQSSKANVMDHLGKPRLMHNGNKVTITSVTEEKYII